MYGLGYGPTLLIIVVFEIWGSLDPNEDRALLKIRAERGRSIDAELGVKKKPRWWSRMTGEHDDYLTTEQRLKNIMSEIGGRRATTRNLERAIEMGNMPAARPSVDENPFPDEAAPAYSNDGPVLPTIDSDATMAQSDRRPELCISNSDGSETAVSERTMTTGASPPQRVRSMLDV